MLSPLLAERPVLGDPYIQIEPPKGDKVVQNPGVILPKPSGHTARFDGPYMPQTKAPFLPTGLPRLCPKFWVVLGQFAGQTPRSCDTVREGGAA